jgi:hypothetical protein
MKDIYNLVKSSLDHTYYNIVLMDSTKYSLSSRDKIVY